MSLIHCVERWAAERPLDAAWVHADGRILTWSGVRQAVAAVRAALWSRGVRSGDRVVTHLPNGWPAVQVALALDSLGAVESPVDFRVDRKEMGRRAALLDARLVISETTAADLLSCSATGSSPLPPLESLPSHRPSLILWTSGTTAEPKGVVLSSSGIMANARGKLAAAPQTTEDVRLTVLPLSHAYARTCDFAAWVISGGVLAAGDGWAAVENQAPRVRPTLMNCVPYIIDRVFGSGADAADHRQRLASLGLDRLRMLGCGGVALPPARFDQIRRLGIAPIHGYGLTEAGPVVCSATPWDCRPGVVGRPIEDTEIRVSESGELFCRGPGVMQGYWNDPEGTAARIDSEGWLRTGDSCLVEPDGMVRILGRTDDVIILSTGRKVWPESIERRLASVPGVRHVVLCGRDAALEAVVDAEGNWTEDELLERFRTILASESNPPPLRGIQLLSGPLAVERGELTSKGTVRRPVVLARVLRRDGES